MGSGHSRFGNNNNRNPQYPYGVPPYPMPYAAAQPGFAPPYAPYGQPVYPNQGFMPPGAQFGQGAYLPPPLLNYLPQDKYFKRSNRPSRSSRSGQRTSDRFVGGFAGATGMPQPEAPQRMRPDPHSRVNAPVIPPMHQHGTQSVSHRTATPFIPPLGDEDLYADDNEDDPPRSANTAAHRSSSRRSTRRYPTPPPIIPDLAHVIDPLEPASRAVFGPSGPRPRAPLRNPLPPPPRDLYEMTPYKSLLTLPQTTALLTATYPTQNTTMPTISPTTIPAGPSVQRKKSIKNGILRAFSRKGKQKAPEQPQVRFIPVFMNKDASLQNQQPHVGMSSAAAGPPSTSATGAAMNVMPSNPAPVPPIPSSPPAIRFDQSGKYAVFMNHSPHRVIWEGQEYPTALHLHEALKFIDTRPDIAEKIRTSERAEEVYPLSAASHEYGRQDWGNVFLDKMKDVLYQKFRQHANLRSLLLSTGAARLIYVDPEDAFWGSGEHENGLNHLGKALADVRQRLTNEAIPAS